MIRKLKNKFILINMLSVGAILITVLSLVLFSSYQSQQAQIRKTLSDTLMVSDKKGEPKFQIGNHDIDNQFQNYASFLVTVSTDGTFTSYIRDNLVIEQETLNSAVLAVQSLRQTTGRISSLNLQYLKESTSDGIRIAFVDTSIQDESFQQLVLILTLSATLGLVAFFLVIIQLAKWSVKPVELAWEQQRQFIADASHELKTPLTVILANTGIMMNHQNDTIANQLKWLQYIKEEAYHMKKLIEDMLFLAKSDSGKTSIPMCDLNLSDLVFEVLLPFESVAFEKNITLSSIIDEQIHINGNSNQLKELVAILLDNAFKYTPIDEQVHLSLKKEQDKIYLAVHNTGVFIPREAQAHLFERFYRPDHSRNLETGGYGLGLAIAKSVVELHHGTIHVKSTPSEGTTFKTVFN